MWHLLKFLQFRKFLHPMIGSVLVNEFWTPPPLPINNVHDRGSERCGHGLG